MENITHAPRQLGLTSATALVVATMVGTGIFTTSGYALSDLHDPWAVMVVWVAGAVFAALGALCYGALSRAIPESGGEYLFVSRTIHPSIGSVVGWVTLPAGFAAPLAASAYAFGKYLGVWLPGWPAQLAGTILILLFSVLHAKNVKGGAWTQNAGVIFNIILILGFIVFALPHARMPEFAPGPAFSSAPLPVYAVSLMWVSYAYFGWNSAAYIGGEIVDPTKNLPRAMLLGTGVVAVLYLALNLAFLGSAPVSELAGKVEIGQVAARAIGGDSFASIVTIMVVFVLTTSVSSFVMAGPRVYAKMAEDGCMPAWMMASGGKPPAVSIWVQTAVALVILWTATFDGLLTYIGFTLSFANAATVVGLVALRRAKGTSIPVPGWPWVPVVFLVMWTVMAVCAFALKPVPSLVGCATLAVGLVFWRIGASAHAKRVAEN